MKKTPKMKKNPKLKFSRGNKKDSKLYNRYVYVYVYVMYVCMYKSTFLKFRITEALCSEIVRIPPLPLTSTPNAFMLMCICMFIYVCICVCIYVYMYICMYVCMCLCIFLTIYSVILRARLTILVQGLIIISD